MSLLPKYTLFVAVTLENGIGLNNGLPWRLPKDLAYFKRITSRIPKHALVDQQNDKKPQNAVVMGRLTWESIPVQMQPLSKRFNIVISRNKNYFKDVPAPPNTALAVNLEDALAQIDPTIHPRIFVVGGAQIYKEAIQSPLCTHILLTQLYSSIPCDTFFPDIDKNIYRRASHEELVAFVEEDVQEGRQTENGLEFEYMLFIRDNVR